MNKSSSHAEGLTILLYDSVADSVRSLQHVHEPRKQQQQQTQHHSLWGIGLMTMGAFSFSVMFLLVKLLSSSDINIFTLVFYRSLVQIIISLVVLLYHKGLHPLGPPEVRGELILRAVFGTLAVAAFFFGIQILPLPDAVVLQFTTPVFAAASAVLVVGEPWHTLDKMGAVACLTGVILIAHPTCLFGHVTDVSSASSDAPAAATSSTVVQALAVLVTTAGAASAGVAYVMVRVIGGRADAVVMVLYYAVLSLPLCIVGSASLQDGHWQVWELGEDFGLTDYALLILMGLGGYGGQWFTNLGLQRESAATATLVTSTQIVWTFAFEQMFLHESLNVWSVAGTGLILGYMVLVGIYKTILSSFVDQMPGHIEEQEWLMSDMEKQQCYHTQTVEDE